MQGRQQNPPQGATREELLSGGIKKILLSLGMGTVAGISALYPPLFIPALILGTASWVPFIWGAADLARGFAKPKSA